MTEYAFLSINIIFISRNNPIPPIIQLLLTSRLYATISHLLAVGDFCGISKTSAHRITHRVSVAIAHLRPEYINFPSTPDEIQNAQLQFYHIARFPKLLGCIDCTHIRVQSFGKTFIFLS